MAEKPKPLPQAIITNIIKRLPVKTLLQFQCVCKQWRNLIKTPSFIALHSHHSSLHNPSLLLQRTAFDTNLPIDLCLLDFNKHFHEVPHIPFDSSVSVTIIGSCNGILCVERCNQRVHSVFLWNPAIRKARVVHSNVYDFEGCIHVGFGYSAVVDDYKILRCYVPEDEGDVNKVEVYSLSTNRWKEIKCGNLEGVKFGCESFCADGGMFWLGSKSDGEEELVISFDIAMEVFTLIPMPPLDEGHKCYGHRLCVYQSKLAVISHFIESVSFTTDSWYVDLWVLEEGVGGCKERWRWIEKYSLITFTDAEHPSGIFRIEPLCIWRDELVCNGLEMSGIVSRNECGEDSEVISVFCLSNLRTNKLRKIASGRCSNEFSVIFSHVESLVPIDSLHIQEVNTVGEKIVDGSTQFFPQEIITNILKRLPVKSLMRFQCVCKQWKNLIMAPTFIFDHLHHSSHHSPSLLFERQGSDTVLPLDLSLLDCEKQFHKVQNIPFDSSVRVKIIGSSNGLLCVKCSSNRVCSLFLWNPAIRKTRQVHSNANDFRGLLFLGYGFSPVVNDCKILRAYALEDEYGDEDEVTRVEVYSLSTDRWKEIKFGNLEGVKFECETFSADGCMFWLGSKSDGEEELVISFDIAMEAFTLIPMPPLDKSNKYFTHKLVVYENKLAVISHFIVGVSFTTDSWYIDLWVLEEAIGAPQERWNWTKKYSLITFTDADLPSGIFRIDPLCIWRGELVCDGLQNSETVSETECEENVEGKEMFGIYGETDWEEYMNEMLGVYGEMEPQEDPGVMSALCLSNLRTNELRKIATGKCNDYYSVIFNHVESLVPIDSIRIREVHQT